MESTVLTFLGGLEVNVPHQAYNIGVIVAMVLGLANCIFGRLMFRLTCGVLVLGIGALWAAIGLHAVGVENQLALSIAGGVVGVLAAVFILIFYKVALFFGGAGGGFGLGMAFYAAARMEWQWWVLAICALVGALAALLLERLVVAVISGLGGAALIAYGGLHFSGYGPSLGKLDEANSDPSMLAELADTPVYVAMGIAVILGIVSIYYQIKRLRAGDEDRESQAE